MIRLVIAAAKGELGKLLEAERKKVEQVGRTAAKSVATDIKLRARGEVRGALGYQASLTIRQKDYPEDGASIVYSSWKRGRGGLFRGPKDTDVLTAYTSGATIRPRFGTKYLLLAAKGVSRKRARQTLDRFGKDKKLALIRAGRGRLILVRKTRTRTTFIATLVPEVRVKKRLEFDRILRRAEPEFTKAILEGSASDRGGHDHGRGAGPMTWPPLPATPGRALGSVLSALASQVLDTRDHPLFDALPPDLQDAMTQLGSAWDRVGEAILEHEGGSPESRDKATAAMPRIFAEAAVAESAAMAALNRARQDWQDDQLKRSP